MAVSSVPAALAVIISAREEVYRDAAMDSCSRIGPTGHPRPDPGSTQRPGALGGYLGHGPNARPAGPGTTGRGAGGLAHCSRHHPAGDRRARLQQSDSPHDRAYQHRRPSPARPPVERVRRRAGHSRNGAPRHPREGLWNRSRFGSQPELQRQTGVHHRSGRGAAQRSGGAQRATRDGARREPLFPRRDPQSHFARHGPA